MRRVVAVVALLMASSPAAMASPERMSAPGLSASGALSVVVDRTVISSSLGDHPSFASTVRNGTGQLKSGLVAHLNVFSLDPNTYVDPEDWSSHRTQFLDTLPSSGEVSLTWPLQVVNSGSLVIYVAVTDTENRSSVVSKSDRADRRAEADHQRRRSSAGGRRHACGGCGAACIERSTAPDAEQSRFSEAVNRGHGC